MAQSQSQAPLARPPLLNWHRRFDLTLPEGKWKWRSWVGAKKSTT